MALHNFAINILLSPFSSLTHLFNAMKGKAHLCSPALQAYITVIPKGPNKSSDPYSSIHHHTLYSTPLLKGASRYYTDKPQAHRPLQPWHGGCGGQWAGDLLGFESPL